MADTRYSVTILSLSGPESAQQVTRFLSLIFQDRLEPEIAGALERLPLLLTAGIQAPAAETLRRHLESRGATLLIEEELVNGQGQARTAGEPVAECVHRRLSPDDRPATSYTMRRPGFRDDVFGRAGRLP